MKFAICNETYEGWKFCHQVENIAELGYDGIEIAPFTLADDVREISSKKRHSLKQTATDAGLEITGLHWLLTRPEGLYLTHPDAAIRQKTMEYLNVLVEFCSDLGGKQLVFGSAKQRNVLPEVQYDDAWKYALDGFRVVSESAGKCGLLFLVESLPPPISNLIINLDEARKMVESVNHPNCRMMVDVKSMSSENHNLFDLIVENADLIEYVHANDANKRGPGFGETDFQPVFSALRKIGYEGFVSVEVFDYSPDPVTIARESLAYMRRCLAEVDG